MNRLGEACIAFERVDAARGPEWMGLFDRGEVVAQDGRVCRDMARRDRTHGEAAVRWTSEAIAAFGPQHVRSSLYNQIGLCSALLLAGELGRALAVGSAVLATAGQVSSRRITDRIAGVRRDLSGHTASGDVREFDHVLATWGSDGVSSGGNGRCTA